MRKIAVHPTSTIAVSATRGAVAENAGAVPAALTEIIESLPEPAYLLDRSHRWVYTNRAYCNYMGRSRGALLGKTMGDIASPRDANAAWETDETAFNKGEMVINETLGVDGASGPQVLQTRRTVVRVGKDSRYLFGIVRDLTDTEDARRLLQGTAVRTDESRCNTRNLGFGQVRFVFSDPLTQLPNRRAAMNQIDMIAGRSIEEAAVLVFNIDHFALVNERFGHGAGDVAIVEVAQRLRVAVGDDVTLGRLDNDEFVILAERCDAMHADLLAERILTGIAAPMQLGDYDYRLSASIGIALIPEHGRSAAELLRNAVLAMRCCKQRRRGGSERYCESTSAAADRRATIELRLPLAIEAGELSVCYQPFVDGGSGELRGFEALARWRDSQLGDVEPSEFIPIAEGMGIIRQVGQTVLEQACETVATFVDERVAISVNVSSVQLLDETFPIFVAETLQRFDVSGDRLLLEITETVAMEADSAVLQVLKELSDIGVQLLIDDFGTGFSNLARLKALPFSGIKVDRAFVHDLPDCAQDSAIFRATHAMATALGLVVIVEGIENEAQDTFVRQFGVDYLQGFRYGRPVPAKKLKRYTREPNVRSSSENR